MSVLQYRGDTRSRPPGHRVACPRCGESFPVKETAAGDSGPHIPVMSRNGTPHADPPAAAPLVSPAKALWPLAAGGAIVAALLVGFGLYAILKPTPRPEPGPDRAKQEKKPATVPPAVVTGLAYLPADTNICAAVQFGPLLTYAARTQTDPHALLTRAGLPGELTDAPDKLGLSYGLIDHVCAGLVVDSASAFPRVVVALVLNQKVPDRSAFLKQLKATQFTAPDGSTRFRADVGNFPWEMLNPDDKTYLFATDGNDLHEFRRGAPGSVRLSAGVRDSMAKLSPASFAWVATGMETWNDKPTVKVAAGLLKQPDLPARLVPYHAAVAGISLEPEPTAAVAVLAVDAVAAAQLRGRLAATLAGRPVAINLVGPWVTVEGALGKDGVGGWKDWLPAPAAK
ncbi:hypothetical protein [Fimbriiglobus ruber]|uniref:Uncharacterized protein n=1 Tax=Fimbriiglobus ruber TaxID=1908690 RepID=A0A225DBC4_9BACT|nr:hypothetical protein [Fimbriiglobus ruber]OWK38870.1 hypothetical protein FRUB_06375 [Fimbriiglobus ruber]